ncbi:acylphosphatase [Phenylobacterium sp.]|uniref:acylphosphatase n=1 Tax=Phenylobacterium sp. TaxID=1871053 RepID=UPI002FC717A6
MQRHAIRLSIHGRVQGVGYRWWATEEALRLGLDGWVRNRRDGSVELLAIGSETGTEQLVAACRRGPPSAQVSRVECTEAQDDGSRGFHDQPTV